MYGLEQLGTEEKGRCRGDPLLRAQCCSVSLVPMTQMASYSDQFTNKEGEVQEVAWPRSHKTDTQRFFQHLISLYMTLGRLLKFSLHFLI